MFFCKANKTTALAPKTLIKTYERVSGQLINAQKSSINFSRRTNQTTKDLMKQLLEIDKEGGIRKYLGLPENFGRKKTDLFAEIVTKIKIKSVSWSTKFLSKAGKMVMLKSVLSSMPTHSMSCFKLPQTMCDMIQTVLTRFWWDNEPEKRKMSWVAWKKMARPKKKGGLGFKDLTAFNDSLLAKISWRILKSHSCLLARCLLGKYCHASSFLSCKVATSASHGWRGILIGRDLLLKQTGWIVGSGTSINAWNDPWLSFSEVLRPMGPPPEHLQSLRVSDLLLDDSSNWDHAKIDRFLPFHKEQILKIKISGEGT